jgi:hypothetical protein
MIQNLVILILGFQDDMIYRLSDNGFDWSDGASKVGIARTGTLAADCTDDYGDETIRRWIKKK